MKAILSLEEFLVLTNSCKTLTNSAKTLIFLFYKENDFEFNSSLLGLDYWIEYKSISDAYKNYSQEERSEAGMLKFMEEYATVLTSQETIVVIEH
jgi:hypothetical protein